MAAVSGGRMLRPRWVRRFPEPRMWDRRRAYPYGRPRLMSVIRTQSFCLAMGVGRVIALGRPRHVIKTGLGCFIRRIGRVGRNGFSRTVGRAPRTIAGGTRRFVRSASEIVQQLADGLVQFREAEETAVFRNSRVSGSSRSTTWTPFPARAGMNRPDRHDGGVDGPPMPT